ncbi:MAG: hypothetical protein K6G40_06025 [Eubacterium sp.]|nr:hypothetical protein [Eubacterium sp.]
MKRFELITKKIGVAVLCASLFISTASLSGCGQTGESEEVNVEESGDASLAEADNEEESKGSGTGTAYKEETVYVTTDMSGNVTDITVSDWLKNNDYYDVLTDVTTLDDVVNVKGDQEITQTGDNLSIDASGEDIYYQGSVESSESLPISIDVSYKLDGKSVSAEELEGQSGKVEITIKYTNNEKTESDGEEVYVPFLVASGVLLDSDNFTNIEVENGKVVSNGYYQTVIGYGLPGMNESLGLEGDDAVFTDEVVITADTTNYNVDSIMSFYTSSVFSDLDFDDVEDTDDLEDSLNELSEASAKLVDGTEELSDGAKELYEGLTEIDEGADTLASGTKSFESSYSTFDAGVKKLDAALATLNTKMNAMYDEIDAAITEYSALAESAPKLAKAYAADDAEATYGGDIQKAMYLAGTYGTPDYDELQQAYAAVQKYYAAYEQYAAAGDAENAQAAITAATQYAAAYNTGCASYYESAALQAKGAAAALQAIKDGMDEEDSSTGLDTKGSLSALQSAGDTLSSASTQLKSAAGKISSGASSLADGTSEAASGSKELYEGSVELKEGMAEFDEEGIQKIVDAFGGDLGDALDKLNAVKDAGESYISYAGISDDAEGEVKFIVTMK